MSLLKALNVGGDIAEEKDVIGGGSRIFDSGIYKFTVSLAYLQKSSGGALGLVLNLKAEDDRELRQTVYITSGDAKGNLPYYTDKKGEKQYLPGFNVGNSLALLTVGRPIFELDTEEKVIPVWNNKTKSEVPTKVQMVTDMLGKEVYVAVLKQIVDKNVESSPGVYVPSGETREENEIDKLFCARDGYEKLTSAEIRAKVPAAEAAFFGQWEKKNAGTVRDKSTKGTGNAGAPKAGGAAPAASSKPTESLFS